MGDTSIDPKIIKKTQDTLGKVIKKPPMSEKILARPTVQYMYDVVISVMKTTGKMKGLFTETELNFENIKGSKEDKVAFFQKAIDYVSLVTGKPIAAKPSKILAGHEPEKTNEFLQVLAEATRKNIDNDDYVKRILKSDDSKPSSKKESSKSKDKESSKGESSKASGDHHEKEHGSDRHHSKDRSKDRSDRGKSRDAEVINGEKESRAKSEDKDKGERHRNRDKDRDDKSHEKDRDREHRDRDRHDKTKDREERSKDRDERSKERGDKSKDRDERSKERGDKSKDREERSKGRGERSKEKDEEEDDEEQQNSRHKKTESKQSEEPPAKEQSRPTQQSRPARPSSARPAPPKPKKTEIVHEEPVVTGLQRPNVIVDKRQDSDDDDDAFIAKEEEIALPLEPVVTKDNDENEDENNGEEHGGLVKKLLESKMEQESTQAKKTEIERSSGVMDASRRKDRERIQKEIEKFQTSIQTTTRNVHPLGRLLDLVQENLDAMQKEKEMWTEEHRQNVIELQQRQSVSDSSLEPLRAELREVDATIADQLDLIAAVKNNLFQNDIKINKMLSSITKS